jgi:hypothetical protein
MLACLPSACGVWPESDMDPLLMILKRLIDQRVELVIVGGMAAMCHGSLIVTQDIDFCVPFDVPTMSRIIAALGAIKPTFRMRPDRMPMYDDPDRLARLNLLAIETELGVVDFLKEVSGVGAFAEVAAQSEPIEVAEGIICRVLTLDALIDAKRAAGRPKDRVAVTQLEALRQKFHHRQLNLPFDEPKPKKPDSDQSPDRPV